MLIASVLLLGGFALKHTLDDPRTVPGLILEGRVLPSSSDPTPEVRQRADAFLDEEVVLQVGLRTERRTRRELGARIDVESASADLLRIGHGESAFTNLATQVRARRSLVRVDISASVDDIALRDALTSIALTFDRARTMSGRLRRHLMAPSFRRWDSSASTPVWASVRRRRAIALPM